MPLNDHIQICTIKILKTFREEETKVKKCYFIPNKSVKK